MSFYAMTATAVPAAGFNQSLRGLAPSQRGSTIIEHHWLPQRLPPSTLHDLTHEVFMKSFLSYLGGKSLLADTIVPLIPEHQTYVEPFAGAAWILFAKEPSKVEVINDINVDIVNLYRVVKHHLEEYIRTFKWLLVAREEFERFRETPPETLTDIQRAVRFFYLLKNGYASKLDFSTFSSSKSSKSSFNLLRIEEILSAAHLRLSRVYIENQSYQRIIEKFDSKETAFYLDPPYWDCEDYYGKGIFSKQDFSTLKDMLMGIQGRFIMSINDAKPIRELYGAFNIKRVKTSYSTASKGAQAKNELLVMNF